MTVRPFDWRDLAYLHQCRHRSVFLHSALVLTRGPLLVPGALFSFLAPGMGIFTAVCEPEGKEDQPVIGQIIHMLGSTFAHLTFVTPEDAFESPALACLLEYLISISGGRGAFRLLADVDERNTTFEILRRSGFAIYTRQRIWQLTRRIARREKSKPWRQATRHDVNAIRQLYNNIVPGLVQQIEPFNGNQRPHGMIYREGDEILAFVELKYGSRGIWAQPFVHPDAQDVTERFFDLLQSLSDRGSAPIYICIRSYQSWLEQAIEELGAEVGPRQAVMVKHLTSMQRALRPLAVPALEGGQPEATASIIPNNSNLGFDGTTRMVTYGEKQNHG